VKNTKKKLKLQEFWNVTGITSDWVKPLN